MYLAFEQICIKKTLIQYDNSIKYTIFFGVTMRVFIAHYDKDLTECVCVYYIYLYLYYNL